MPKRERRSLPPLDLRQRYTVEESCEYLRTSRARLYAKIKAGEISVLKDGSRTYVSGRTIAALSQPAA